MTMKSISAWTQELSPIISQQVTPELAQDIYNQLRLVTSALDTYSRSQLRAFSLTIPQFDILRHASSEGVPLSEISARMMCDNSNLTAIVDRLAAEGLVEREVASYDRRVRLVRLTEAGSDKLDSIGPHYADAVTRLISSLSEDQAQLLSDLLCALRPDTLLPMQFSDSLDG